MSNEWTTHWAARILLINRFFDVLLVLGRTPINDTHLFFLAAHARVFCMLVVSE